MRRRVAVTGLSIISPCGNNTRDFSAIIVLEEMDRANQRCAHIYGELLGCREAKVNTVMSNSFAFGGTNAGLIVRKTDR
jgi:3-oxoacyl-(acyl-carrier-protein) synthase